MERGLCYSAEKCILSGTLAPRTLWFNSDENRLPVPSLWLDIFHKIRALGFNCVSFYIDWALLEGKPGDYRAEGIFALEPFFDAAKEAGIYLIARPGSYINAEVSGGGFPGWLQRVNGTLRSSDEPFLKATDKYGLIDELLQTLAYSVILAISPMPLLPWRRLKSRMEGQ